MEDVVKRIISIDKETIKVIDKAEEIKITSERSLRDKLAELEKTQMEQGRMDAEINFKEIIDQGTKEVQILKKANEVKLSNIDNLYKGKKKDLVDSLFQSLVKENE